jgi:uncharacterized protein (TIGR00252 family)
MNAPHIALGTDGEDLAADWYRQHGFTIVDRNWRATFGEIDLVAASGSLLVIAEVKTRRTDAFGSPALAVGPAKQRRLRRLAAAWLAEQGAHRRYDVRFDVVAVVGDTIDVYANAF